MVDPMHVIFVLATSTGGIGTHVRGLAAGLVKRGVTVTVAGPQATEQGFGFTSVGAVFRPVEIATRPRPVGDGKAVLALKSVVAAAGAEAAADSGSSRSTGIAGQAAPVVVHAHGLRAGFVAGLATKARPRLARSLRPGRLRRSPHGRAYRLPTGCPLVVTWHNAVLGGGPQRVALAGLERTVAKMADVTLGASYDLVARARELGAKDARLGQVAAPAFLIARRSRDEVRAELDADDRPLVLAVGRLAKQKSYGLLLDAAARWRARTPVPLVLVAGDGPERRTLQARIDAEDLPVRLLGYRADVADLLAAADVIALTSEWEARALVAQEALRAGRPLVATAVGGVPDLVGEAALLVPYNDPDALADAVGAVLDDPEVADRLARAGPAQAATWPDENTVIDAVVDVYTELTTDSPADTRRTRPPSVRTDRLEARGQAVDEPDGITKPRQE